MFFDIFFFTPPGVFGRQCRSVNFGNLRHTPYMTCPINFLHFFHILQHCCCDLPGVAGRNNVSMCSSYMGLVLLYSTMTPRLRRWHTSRFVAHLLTFASGGPSRQVRPPLLVSHNWPSVNTVSTAACPGSHSTHTGGTTRTPLGPPFWHSYVPTRWGP